MHFKNINNKINTLKDYKKTVKIFLGYYICHKLVNNLMLKGKKDKAYKIVSKILEELSVHFNYYNPFLIITKVIMMISLPFRFKKKRVAGRNFSIPLFMLLENQINYYVKFFVKNIRDRNEKNINKSFLNEVLDIFNNNNSISLKKRKDLIRLAIENKYYTKYL